MYLFAVEVYRFVGDVYVFMVLQISYLFVGDVVPFLW